MIMTEYGNLANNIQVNKYSGFIEIVVGPDRCEGIGSESVEFTNSQFIEFVNKLNEIKEQMI